MSNSCSIESGRRSPLLEAPWTKKKAARRRPSI
jgi:hypothetical protein